LGRRQVLRLEIYHQQIDLALIGPDLKGLNGVILGDAPTTHFPSPSAHLRADVDAIRVPIGTNSSSAKLIV
jgi:hypothetical protein